MLCLMLNWMEPANLYTNGIIGKIDLNTHAMWRKVAAARGAGRERVHN